MYGRQRFPGLMVLAVILVGLLVAGCPGDDMEEADETETTETGVTDTTEATEDTETTEAAADEDQAMAEELWSTIEEANYRENWTSSPKGEKYAGLEPHGSLVSLYLNEEGAPALRENLDEMADGSIIVKENWQDEETLAGLTVMQKVSGYNADHGDWFWAQLSPEGQVAAAGSIDSCEACHGAVQSNDYVFSFPVGQITP